MIALLAAHPGTHAVAHAAPIAALPLIFCRAIAAVRRKPAAPEVQTPASGAGAGGSDWNDAMPAEPAAARHPETAPGGYPVLRDRMLSQVRNEWDRQGLVPAQQAAHADAVHAMSERYLPAAPEMIGGFPVTRHRPVNGRSLGDQPRRHPELNRQFTNRPGADVLRQVIAGLKNLDKPKAPAYRNGWQ